MSFSSVRQTLVAVLGQASPWLLFERTYISAGLFCSVGVFLIILNSVPLSVASIVHLDPHAPAISVDVQDPFSAGGLFTDYWGDRCTTIFTLAELLNVVEKHPSAVLDALPLIYCADPEFFIDFGLPHSRLEGLYSDQFVDS